jgi:hypothetical protein
MPACILKTFLNFKRKNHLCNIWKDVFSFNFLGIVIQFSSVDLIFRLWAFIVINVKEMVVFNSIR